MVILSDKDNGDYRGQCTAAQISICESASPHCPASCMHVFSNAPKNRFTGDHSDRC